MIQTTNLSRVSPITLALAIVLCITVMAEEGPILSPYPANPAYWQYKGEPVLLLGGSKDDSLFQIPDLKEHLDEMRAAGVNYARNTMSARQDFGFEIYPFKSVEGGKYDLEQWNDAYWERFENLLRWSNERDIIIQIEVWDRFDYSQEQWAASPWRPANNVNYTVESSGLLNAYPAPAWHDKQPFFHSIPDMPGYLSALDLVRGYQERLVAKMLSISLQYGNVLYCMDNETSTDPRWGLHWIHFIKQKAGEAGQQVFTTDMFDDGWKPEASAKLKFALEHPADYDFIDISQVNSRSFDEAHWNHFAWVVDQVKESPRPLNHVKIYSDGETNWGSGTPVDGVERFWRNLIGGASACRFHRPGAGIGLNETAKACIAAARKLETVVKLWDVTARQDLLSDRDADEAYLAAKPGEAYVLFFTDGGSVTLTLPVEAAAFQVKWIDIGTGNWGRAGKLESATITAPGKGPWVVAIIGAVPN